MSDEMKSPAPEASPEPKKASKPKAPKGTKVSPEGAPVEFYVESQSEAAPEASPEPEAVKPPPPSCVRVKRHGRGKVMGPDGKPMVLRIHDVFVGEDAAFLFEHCSERVEVYPKPSEE